MKFLTSQLTHLFTQSDLGDLPAAFNPIHYASPKLRRVAPPRHIVLLSR